jgi:N-carbamoyl-L-amino-acid hydrolase
MVIEINTNGLQAAIDELAAISEAPAPAVTRVLFGKEDLRARVWLKKRAADEGLSVREDAVGNLFFRWPGSQPELPAVATGSHTDAIPNAGRYDGVVGVLGGLEALAALKRAGLRPRRSLEVIMFTAEEPTRFGIGCLGSRLLAGALSLERAAALRDGEGRSLEEWRAAAGVRGDLACVRLHPGAYAAFVELHIEQGPLLEREKLSIGAVEKIAGPSSYRVRLTGEGGHAGAMLMPDRHDAGLAGAEIALAVEDAAKTSGSPDTVGTTGVFRQEPNAVNSVPCAATLEIDFRDTDLAARTAAWARVEKAVAEICARRGVRSQLEQVNSEAPAQCAPDLVSTVQAVCGELGLTVKRMISRAYHDSLFMAQVCPTTMIFIPCRGGVSHRPDEYSSPEQIAAGVRVLAHTLAQLTADA